MFSTLRRFNLLYCHVPHIYEVKAVGGFKLRRILIVRGRAILISLALVILIAELIMGNLWLKNASTLILNQQSQPDKAYFEPAEPTEGSLEEIYQDVFMLLLLPSIEEVVQDYYMATVGHSPNVDPWDAKIIFLERPNGYRTFGFRIKLEVAPYLGAHNAIGVDHITMEVSLGEIKVVAHLHIKSYTIPPHLR